MFAPKEQQIEGMKFTLKQIGFKEYCRALRNLCANGMCSKSEMHKRIKMARHILGIPYEARDRR